MNGYTAPWDSIEIDAPDREPGVLRLALPDQISFHTLSLTSSASNYNFENGRRYHSYHNNSQYPLPNDDSEFDRLELHHVMMKKAVGDRLYHAPIPQNVQRILDVATGTGIWAIEMAEEFPNAEILGNDLSPIQPDTAPPNVFFEVDDVESEWVLSSPSDFVFCRYLTCCITDWPKLTEEIFNHLTPGGWAEFHDYDLQYYSEDGSLTERHKMSQWITKIIDASRSIDREPSPGLFHAEWMRKAGFKNIKHLVFKVPVGPWAKEPRMKEIGMMNLVQTLEGLEAFTLRLFCSVLGWKPDEVHALLDDVRSELESGELHTILDFHVTYGQKPDVGEEEVPEKIES